MSYKKSQLECTYQRSGKKQVLRNARLAEYCDFLLPIISSEKVSVSTPHFTSSFDVNPSVGKCFCEQSIEYPTPLNQPIVQYGAALVSFI